MAFVTDGLGRGARATLGPLAILALMLTTSCGTNDRTAADADFTGGIEPQSEKQESRDIVDFDPRELVSFTNTGSAQTMVTFESYQQLRDYSDLSVIATVKSVEVARSFEAPYTSSGELHIGLNIDAMLGGRFSSFSVDDELTMSLPMDAPADLVPEMLQRLHALVGQARYVLFLQQVPPYDEGVRFRPLLYGASGSPGHPEGEPPAGWDRLEPLLADA